MSITTGGGFMVTVGLFAIAKITLSEWANVATIVSGCAVLIVNLPRIIETIKTLLKSKRRGRTIRK